MCCVDRLNPPAIGDAVNGHPDRLNFVALDPGGKVQEGQGVVFERGLEFRVIDALGRRVDASDRDMVLRDFAWARCCLERCGSGSLTSLTSFDVHWHVARWEQPSIAAEGLSAGAALAGGAAEHDMTNDELGTMPIDGHVQSGASI